jgi:hypothetical protein
MKNNAFRRAIAVACVLVAALLAPLLTADTAKAGEASPIKSPVSTGTGLLALPPFDSSDFSTEDFVSISSTVGTNKIYKKWTSPVVALPPHPRANVHGLTEDEVKDYMRQVRHLFDEGKAIPSSHVSLIASSEDVMRMPMIDHISAFSNSVASVYLLVQKKPQKNKKWGYFSLVQDLTTDPPLNYFAEFKGNEVNFAGNDCFKCHSSGPLVIRPLRADLLSDPALTAALNEHIAAHPPSTYYFPTNKIPRDYGKPLAMKSCTKCHDTDGVRSPLFKVHEYPIRTLVDFGYMPPKRRLTPTEIAELKAWLDSQP